MPEIETPEAPVIKPKVKIDKKTKRKLLHKVEEEGQVIVHCVFKNAQIDCVIRIWQTTYLYPKESSHKSKLIHYENISIAPTWTIIEKGGTHHFTLIFSALPKSCKVFDLVEEIAEPDGFVFRNIIRNKTDVYTIRFN